MFLYQFAKYALAELGQTGERENNAMEKKENKTNRELHRVERFAAHCWRSVRRALDYWRKKRYSEKCSAQPERDDSRIEGEKRDRAPCLLLLNTPRTTLGPPTSHTS